MESKANFLIGEIHEFLNFLKKEITGINPELDEKMNIFIQERRKALKEWKKLKGGNQDGNKTRKD